MTTSNPIEGHSDPAFASGPRGNVWLAWLATAAIVAGVIASQQIQRESKAARPQAGGDTSMLELSARATVGTVEQLRQAKTDDAAAIQKAIDKATDEAAALNTGGIGQRHRAIIVLGEIAGPQEAVKQLDELNSIADDIGYVPTDGEKKTHDILLRLYTDYGDGRPTAPTVIPDEREAILKELGWFGELALAPKVGDAAPNAAMKAARQSVLAAAASTTATLAMFGLILGVGLVVGVVGLFLIAIQALRGRWVSRMGPAVPHHGVYMETFALWLAIFVGMSLAVPLIGAECLSLFSRLAIAMGLSLIVLAWPVWRGIPWRQVREDVGLTGGKTPFLEPALGILSYFRSLPFAVAGLVISMWLLKSLATGGPTAPFEPSPSISHPVIEMLRNTSGWGLVPIFVFGCVVAPIVEEIMFRGVFYRHMRDATRTWWFGGIISALVVSVIFAAVHPQGLLFIPPLAGLACGFTLARDWRGTLIPSIIAHALNNTVMIGLVTTCLSR